jgi:hypothetical protein
MGLLIGSAIVIASGLFLLWYEARSQRAIGVVPFVPAKTGLVVTGIVAALTSDSARRRCGGGRMPVRPLLSWRASPICHATR